MPTTTYEEIVTRIPMLTPDEQSSLIEMIRLQQAANALAQPVTAKNGSRPIVRRVPVRSFDAERAWVDANREQYRGQWVALKDGRLILSDFDERMFSERLADSGVTSPFIIYIETEAEEDYIGGWL